MIFDKEKFAEDIKSHRVAEGISTRGLSRKTGVGSATITRMENVSDPSMSNFCKLCTWLEEEPNKYFK